MRHTLWILAAVLALAAGGTAADAAAKPVRWIKLADCSAFYRVDARLAPADGSAARSAQAADSYARAAATRFGEQRKATPIVAQHAVDARIKAGLERFAGKPLRVDVLKLIGKCPAVGG
jgi:hypothetical protein